MTRLACSFVLLIAMLGCDDTDSTQPPDSGTVVTPDSGTAMPPDGGEIGAAETALFAAMNEADYDTLDEVIAKLDAAHAGAPGDNRTTFLLGIAHLWKVAEAARYPETAATVSAMHGPLVGRYLGQAHGRDPQNAVHAGFFGVFQWDFGRILGNDEMAAQGQALIDQAAATFPEFGLFLQVLAYRQLPVTDPNFQAGVDALWQWMDVCMQATIDRENPDIEPYLTEELIDGFTGERVFCWESERVPNAVKGAYLYGGDLLVKNGNVTAARVMYENAKLIPGYDSWPHRDAIEARLVDDLNARAALYQDSDPTNDPPQGKQPYSCTVCHQSM